MTALVLKLESSLTKEEKYYNQLLDLMQEEVAAIEDFQPDKLQSCAEKREQLLIDIATAADARAEIQNEMIREAGLEPGENATLTEVVELLPQGRVRELLRKRVETFKQLVVAVHVKARELNRLVGWSMNVVNGSVSIIRSSAVEEVKGYARNGSENNSFHPRYGRASLNLKEA